MIFAIHSDSRSCRRSRRITAWLIKIVEEMRKDLLATQAGNLYGKFSIHDIISKIHPSSESKTR